MALYRHNDLLQRTISEKEKKQVIRDFEGLVRQSKHTHCKCCRRIRIKQELSQKHSICTSCRKFKDNQYFLRNNGLPVWYLNGDSSNDPNFCIPLELKNLSMAEKMLIQRVSPFVPLHHIKNGVMGLKGHVCAFEQNIKGMVNELPRKRDDIDMLRVEQTILTEIGSESFQRKAFKVSRSKVVTALFWLKQHNPEYFDIEIQESNLDWLGTSDIGYLDVKTLVIEDDNIEDSINEDNGPIPSSQPKPDFISTTGYVDNGGQANLSESDEDINETLQKTVEMSPNKKSINMSWPKISKTAVNEYSDVKVFCRAFPWLFPGGFGDPKDYPQSVGEWGSQMLFYEDARFIVDPIFSFFALNYIIRHRNASSGRFFIEKFQQNCPDTLEDLKKEIEAGDTTFINSLSYYNKRVKGSNSYWKQKRSELYTWINHHVDVGNGVPMFFITLSCAEYFWKDVEEMLKDRMDLAGLDTTDCKVGAPGFSQIVNDFAVVVQEYFQDRVVTWLDTVGKVIFGIEHYWVRYEFAPGRGQIHAHLLAISKDQEVYTIAHQAAKFDAEANESEPTRAKILSEWASSKFGLTASVGDDFDSRNINDEQPTTIRFTDLGDDPKQHTEDIENLKKAVQVHDCSGFCMKPPKRKE